MSKSTAYRLVIVAVAMFSMLIVLQCSDSPEGPEPEQYDFDFSASLTDDGVVMSWNTVDLDGIHGFHLYRSENVNNGFSLIGTFGCDSCSYMDDSVTAAVTYYYYVTLYNTSGVDVDTSEVQVVTITGGSIEVSMSSWTASWLGDASTQITVENGGNFATADWEITETAAWLTVGPTTGSVPGTFNLIADSNLTKAQRFTSVWVNVTGLTPVQINVNQHAAFRHVAEYDAGTYPVSICTLDYDVDGDNDLAVVNLYSGNVRLYENNGSGSFEDGGTLWDLHNPGSITSADFDGDGDPDLAVTAYYYYNEVTICWNDGGGDFTSSSIISLDGQSSSACACDLDDDGDMDLVTSILQGRVAISLNNNNGSFADPVTYTTASRSRGLCASDMDEDGDLDLAVVNDDSDNLSVLVGNGDGTFEPAVNYDVGDFPIAVTSADIDGDGNKDLIVSNYHGETISILRGAGNSTFSSQVILQVTGGPTHIMTFDVDDDGDVDLCARLIDSYDGYLALMRNNGDGTFAECIYFDACVGSAADADLDGDGDPDIATTCFNDAISIFLNTR